ncbi:hypothetical protein CEE35_09050 [Candidatus Aerophobetes bacterium Ae_b3b]|nr:MAG: hypothetical protein CEE35_09050 [Candidatus Aerophobetes bacterium Ae_b3b]
MTRIEDSVDINVAPEKVSQYLWNASNLPNHLPISDIEMLEESKEVVKFRHKITAAGRTMNVVCEMRQPELNRKIAFKTVEGMRVEGTWLLEPTKKGTKLTAVIEYTPPGWIFGPILDKLKIKKEMGRMYTESLQKLKKTLEWKIARSLKE